MKRLNFLLLLSIFFTLSITLTAQHKIIIQTEKASALSLSDTSLDSIYQIPEYRKSSGGFLLQCTDPTKLFIVNQSTSETINFQLLWLNNNYSTEPISLEFGRAISIQKCFDTHQKDYFWTSLKNVYEKISRFFNEARYGVVARGRNAFLHGNEEPPATEFVVYEPNFLKPEALEITWRSEEIVTVVEIVADESGKDIAKIKKPKSTKLSYGDLSRKEKKELKPGHQYTLNLTTLDSLNQEHLYQTPFYFLSKTELEGLMSFME